MGIFAAYSLNLYGVLPYHSTDCINWKLTSSTILSSTAWSSAADYGNSQFLMVSSTEPIDILQILDSPGAKFQMRPMVQRALSSAQANLKINPRHS